MTGHIRDLTRTMNGQYVISVQVEGDPRELCDKLKDAQIDIEIKKHRQRRSLDANSYAWVLIGKIAEEMHVDRADVYREAIRAIGGTSTIVCVPDKAVETLLDGWKSKGMGWQTETMPSKIKGCTNVVLYYGSSTYDTRQMSLLIDHLVQDAKALGIETMAPRELEAMLGQHHAA
jgi:S-adenosylmethionine synthetase